ncbi:MAG: thiamine-phosphate kinase [Phycisphaeraceae bacterium]
MREFDLLRHIYDGNRGLPTRVTIPPGDDMGAVRIGDQEVLVTVDQIADGVHFDLATMPLERIARKAITRNLSDVAAMAAVPVGAVAAACLPGDMTQAQATELFDHMRRVAEQYDCPLFGGDVSVWPGRLLLSVTVLAKADGIAPLRRNGAQVGDVICVTGRLGGSLHELDGHTHHLDFEPRLAIARKLAGNADTRPHCMIDLSDGLARDLGHLCRAAGVSAQVQAAALPVSSAAHRAAHADHRDVWRHAVADGEDYELCFTVSPRQAERSLPGEIDGVAITEVGLVTPANGDSRVMLDLLDGQKVDITDLGWEHGQVEIGK